MVRNRSFGGEIMPAGFIFESKCIMIRPFPSKNNMGNATKSLPKRLASARFSSLPSSKIARHELSSHAPPTASFHLISLRLQPRKSSFWP